MKGDFLTKHRPIAIDATSSSLDGSNRNVFIVGAPQSSRFSSIATRETTGSNTLPIQEERSAVSEQYRARLDREIEQKLEALLASDQISAERKIEILRNLLAIAVPEQ